MKVLKMIPYFVVLFFAIGTGLTTAAYVKNCKKIPDFFKNLWFIIALVISSVVLNYFLYKKDLDDGKGVINPLSGFQIKDIPALVITLASSVAVFLFTLWSIPTLGYSIPSALIWLFAISAGLSTFFLFLNDTKGKIADLAAGISSFGINTISNIGSHFSESPVKSIAKIVLTAVFSYGTYGYLNTTFETLKSHMPDNLYYLALTFIVLLAISEFILIFSSAEKFVNKTFKNIKDASLWKLLWIIPLALNAGANGVLDAFAVPAGRFFPALFSGIGLSAGVMSNEVFDGPESNSGNKKNC